MPLAYDVDGVLRVAGTRVRLDTVVGAFQQGATAEEIAQQYPALDLTAVYAVIAFLPTSRGAPVRGAPGPAGGLVAWRTA